MYLSFIILCVFVGSALGGREFFITPEANSIVEQGTPLCLKWRNEHPKFIDPYRGYITFNLLGDNNIYPLIENVDYLAYEGITAMLSNNIKTGTYRVLAELESCKYGEKAYLSEPFRVVERNSTTNVAQMYGISPLVEMEIDNCNILPFFPPQLECEEIPELKEKDEEKCSISIELDIRTLSRGIIEVENIKIDNECQLENEDVFNIVEKEKIKSSIYCLSDEDCYPNEYCDNFKKIREINGYWLCQTQK